MSSLVAGFGTGFSCTFANSFRLAAGCLGFPAESFATGLGFLGGVEEIWLPTGSLTSIRFLLTAFDILTLKKEAGKCHSNNSDLSRTMHSTLKVIGDLRSLVISLTLSKPDYRDLSCCSPHVWPLVRLGYLPYHHHNLPPMIYARNIQRQLRKCVPFSSCFNILKKKSY